MIRAAVRLGIGAVAMLALAQVRPQQLRKAAPWIYVVGIVLLVIVDALGVIGKGAQRWLDLGFVRFQPSEIMKIAVPMLCAWYLHERPLPPSPLRTGDAGPDHPGSRRTHCRCSRTSARPSSSPSPACSWW